MEKQHGEALYIGLSQKARRDNKTGKHQSKRKCKG
jgi:hypothetical protein